MKRHLICILTIFFFLSAPTISWAGRKSVSDGVYRQTFFNDVTDTLAILGKSETEKAFIKKQRHMARVKARQEKLHEEIHQSIIRR